MNIVFAIYIAVNVALANGHATQAQVVDVATQETRSPQPAYALGTPILFTVVEE